MRTSQWWVATLLLLGLNAPRVDGRPGDKEGFMPAAYRPAVIDSNTLVLISSHFIRCLQQGDSALLPIMKLIRAEVWKEARRSCFV